MSRENASKRVADLRLTATQMLEDLWRLVKDIEDIPKEPPSEIDRLKRINDAYREEIERLQRLVGDESAVTNDLSRSDLWEEVRRRNDQITKQADEIVNLKSVIRGLEMQVRDYRRGMGANWPPSDRLYYHKTGPCPGTGINVLLDETAKRQGNQLIYLVRIHPEKDLWVWSETKSPSHFGTAPWDEAADCAASDSLLVVR